MSKSWENGKEKIGCEMRNQLAVIKCNVDSSNKGVQVAISILLKISELPELDKPPVKEG